MVPCDLSGGQQQRVAIARAMAMNPDVLFFDEPTSALDPELTREVLKVIRDLAAEHMTMVIVTHEMGFARDVADHLIFMDGGVIVEQGPASEVINNPQHDRTRALLAFSHRLEGGSKTARKRLGGGRRGVRWPMHGRRASLHLRSGWCAYTDWCISVTQA